jgi:dTDP-4-dehydrorhamnose 3,5-epimerase
VPKQDRLEKISTAHPEVFILRPKVFPDDRGYFMETYHLNDFSECGIDDIFVQDNQSYSKQKNIVRGLHYQLEHPQAKICRVVSGSVLDVAADIRLGSPYFGICVTMVLSASEGNQIYIPRGFAHGFRVLEDNTTFI